MVNPLGTFRHLTYAATAAVLPILLLLAACGSSAKPATSTPSAASSPTIAGSPRVTGATAPAGTAAPATTGTTAPGGGTPPATATATPILIQVTPPPAPDSAPCTVGQLKGDKSTMNLYYPGQAGYNDLKSNVQCFNTPDAATSAGYHLPGR